MNVLIDTNIILDVIQKRQPFLMMRIRFFSSALETSTMVL